MSWWNTLLLTVLALATIATCVNSEQEEKLNEEVKKRSVGDEDVMAPEDVMALEAGEAGDADKRSRLFRYGRGGIMRYGKRAPSVFRYGKRAPAVFRYGKRSDDVDAYADDMDVKRLFRWGKRSDLTNDDVKRLFRWGKRADDQAAMMDALAEAEDAEEEVAKRTVFRYGKRNGADASDKKRRVFRFGKRTAADALDLDAYQYGRDTRNPEQPHVPFRFGDE